MSDAFISYRRKPSAPQASLLQEKLKNRHNIDAYLDTTRTDSTKVSFPERLMGAIEEAPTFILMLGDTTLESEWVLKEIQRAYELKKHCISVFQESYAPTNSQDPAVNYVLNFDGVHLFDVKNIMIDESVANIARLIIGKTPIQPEPVSMIESHVRITFPKNRWLRTFIAFIAFILFLVIATIGLSSLMDIFASRIANENSTQSDIVTEEIGTTPSEASSITPVNTVSSIISPEQLALTPVARNEDWIPYERDFDGVTMVLVPVGCFMMGSETGNYEQPVHQKCIDEVFWIDEYEVTREQYQMCVDLNICTPVPENIYSTDENQPINRVNWFQAKQYCEWRDSRLPNEVEWEYAARGPNSLIYPWGDEFVSNNVAYSANSNGKTTSVDNYIGGISWVGAYNMSGNVWEWTNSLLGDYPYETGDGRERDTGDDTTVIRVVRGGSWGVDASNMKSSVRNWVSPIYEDVYLGFRCARDFEG